jgi:hypothetical protein
LFVTLFLQKSLLLLAALLDGGPGIAFFPAVAAVILDVFVCTTVACVTALACVPAVACVPAITGIPADPGIPIFAGVFTYCNV